MTPAAYAKVLVLSPRTVKVLIYALEMDTFKFDSAISIGRCRYVLGMFLLFELGDVPLFRLIDVLHP